jgi:transposase
MTTNQTRKPYPTDLTDEQWMLLEPIVPPVASGGAQGGRPAVHSRREIVNAIFYINRSGGAWWLMPHDLPPHQTVYGYFAAWTAEGTWARIHDTLREKVRAAEGKAPEPTASIIDAQSVQGSDTVSRPTRGYDAGKKVNGRKRHIAVDTLGMLLVVMVTGANVQDRDGGKMVLWQLRNFFRTIEVTWADGGYAGKLVVWARETLRLRVDIVKRSDAAKGFVVLPHRWIVERTFAWFLKCRRMVRCYERKPEHEEAMAQIVMIGIMTRRLARQTPKAKSSKNVATITKLQPLQATSPPREVIDIAA